MKMTSRVVVHRAALGVLMLAALAQAGCDRTAGLEFQAQPASRLELTSYRDPYFPESYRLTLQNCTAWTDRSGDLHIVGQSTSYFDTLTGPVQQYLHIQVYWRPRPGRTPADASLHDALLRYVTTTDSGASIYEGSGFVTSRRLADGRLAVAIERAQFRRTGQRGEAPDLLGTTRLTGRLLARIAPGDTVDHLREMRVLAAGEGWPP